MTDSGSLSSPIDSGHDDFINYVHSLWPFVQIVSGTGCHTESVMSKYDSQKMTLNLIISVYVSVQMYHKNQARART
jgi:hypothetical protein